MHRTQVGGLAEAEVRPHVAPRALARDGHVSEALAAVEPLLAPERLAGLTEEDAALLLATALECRLARGDVGDALALGERLAAYLVRPGRTGAARPPRGRRALRGPQRGGHGGPALRGGRGAADARCGRRASWCRGASAPRSARSGSGAGPRRPPWPASSTSWPPGHRPAPPSPCARWPPRRPAVTGRRCCAGPWRPSRRSGTAGSRRRSRPTSPGCCCSRATPSAERAEALGLLRRAEAYAGRHQLWPLQTRVRGLLERAGEPARPGPQEVLATLTATERRISTLAAEGLTNRAIAARLDVSAKNVEWHLSHVYRKLGIRSRAGLAPTFAAVVSGRGRLVGWFITVCRRALTSLGELTPGSGGFPAYRGEPTRRRPLSRPGSRRTSSRGTPRCPRSRPRDRSRWP